MKSIGYFIRGIWRELVCLVIKTKKAYIQFLDLSAKTRSSYTQLDIRMRLAVWWTLFGAQLGLALAIYLTAMEVHNARLVRPELINADYWAVATVGTIGVTFIGAVVIWIPVAIVVGLYLFTKHTVNVGKA